MGSSKSTRTETESGEAPPSEQPEVPDRQEAMRRLASLRGKLLTAFAQVTISMMALPRYRHLSLADLSAIVLDPLIRDKIAIAASKSQDGTIDDGAMAGIALWASVSDEVDAKIREQVKAGVFPVRLKPDEWNSGGTVWLLDVIAPTTALATSVLTSFKQVAKQSTVLIHPMVARSVDQEVLAKLAVKADKAET